MKKKITIRSLVSAGSLILLLVSLLIDKTFLIINMGIQAARITGWAVSGLLGIIFLLNTISLLRVIMKNQKPAKPAAPLRVEKEEDYDEDAIKQEVLKLLKLRPNLQGELRQACEQMDSINRKQAKIKEIFTRNKMDIDEVEETIAIAEKSLLHNVVKIINRADLWDTEECNRAEKADIYKEHRTQIQNRLKQNEEILINCDELLSATMIYMETKNKDSASGQLHLETMTEAIKKLSI